MSQLNKPVRVETTIDGKKLTLETGRFAKQAHGSVFIQYGETSALVTAVSSYELDEKLDFFPLTLEFQEKFYSSGKIPGGYFKREAKPTEWATLNARMVDRPLRPLFPEGYMYPTQIVITLLSYDGETEPETIAGLGASASLMVSDIPFTTPVATVRVGRLKGQYVLNPSIAQLAECDISVLVSATKDAICMVEGGADHVAEEDFLGALYFGFEKIQTLLKLQEALAEKVKPTKRPFEAPAKLDANIVSEIETFLQPKLQEAYSTREKKKRYEILDAASEALKAHMTTKFAEVMADDKLAKKVMNEVEECKYRYVRKLVVSTKKRIDGRNPTDVRTIETEVGVLPRVHGSALFTRGETQALVTVTLGTSEDEQLIDMAMGKVNKRFMLHYNFPPFSVGEIGRFGGNSRREVGHSALAERGVATVVPNAETFPYTIRVVSEVLESNGSSSMATVCGASMAMMDAGVPVTTPVAGIAMGLIKEGNDTMVLSDILGDEDHLGDMDFKVVGSHKGVTAVQMDIKISGVTQETMKQALLQAKQGRLHILGEMEKTISKGRAEISEYAPRRTVIQISQERIKDLIGPQGKNIKNIVAVTGAKVDIDDSGKVTVFATDPQQAAKAVEMVKALTEEAEVGKIYMGTVKRLADFGAFVEILPGTDGLVHISELAHARVAQVSDVVQEGDQIPVKVLEVDRQGRIRLSRKAALPQPAAPNA